MHNKQSKLTIFFGDVDESVAKTATEFDDSARLIDHSNYKDFLIADRGQYTSIYTSLGDLPKNLEIVYQVLIKADTIIYCPPLTWSDHKILNFASSVDSIQGLSELLLCMMPPRIEIKNFSFDIPAVIPLVDKRKSIQPQLWNAGCSISHGIGVNLNQRYGQLLADELSMPCSFLTRPGSAIDWAADQILRSDIQSNDIVVWGLTSPERFTYVYDNQLLSGVNVRSYEYFPEYKKIVDPSNLYSQNTICKHIYAIHQVTNYCKKIKAHLILIELLSGAHPIQKFFQHQENYVKPKYRYSFKNLEIQTHFVDLGADKAHPGPQQHKQYKELVLQKLKQLEIV